MNEWISIPQYAKQCGKSVQWIYNLVKKGKLESKKINIEQTLVKNIPYDDLQNKHRVQN